MDPLKLSGEVALIMAKIAGFLGKSACWKRASPDCTFADMFRVTQKEHLVTPFDISIFHNGSVLFNKPVNLEWLPYWSFRAHPYSDASVVPGFS